MYSLALESAGVIGLFTWCNRKRGAVVIESADRVVGFESCLPVCGLVVVSESDRR
jgi:hypothetical protein